MGKSVKDPLNILDGNSSPQPSADPLGILSDDKKKVSSESSSLSGGSASVATSPSTSPSPSSSTSPVSSAPTPTPRPVTPKADLNKDALDRVLTVARQQSGKDPFMPQGIFGQPKDPVQQNEQDLVEQNILKGDVNTITEVIKKQQQFIHQQPLTPTDTDVQQSSMAGLTGDPRAGLVPLKKAKDEVEEQKRQLAIDGARLVSNSIVSQYDQTPKTQEDRQRLGDQMRKAFYEMGYPNITPGVDGSYGSDLLRISQQVKDASYSAAKKLIQPFNPARNADGTPMDPAQATTLMGGRLKQPDPDRHGVIGDTKVTQAAKMYPAFSEAKQYKDEHTLLESVSTNLIDKLNRFADDPKVYAYEHGDASQKTALENDPTVQAYTQTLQDYLGNIRQTNGLYKQYPKVAKDVEKQMVVDQFASDMMKEGNLAVNWTDLTKGVDALNHNYKNIFAPVRLDNPEEIRSVMEATGLDEATVRKYAEDAKIPSLLGQVFRSTANTVAQAGEWLNRKLNDSISADIENKGIEDHLYHIPSPLQLRSGNMNLQTVTRQMADGFGQFAGYTLLTAGIGEGLGAAGRGASILAGLADSAAEGVGMVEKGQGLGRLLNISSDVVSSVTGSAERARELAATYAAGYTSSYEQSYQEAKQYSGDPKKWAEYADHSAFLNGISELILPDIDVAKKALASANIKSLMKEGKMFLSKADLFKAYAGELASIIGKETAEEYIPLIGQTLDKQRLFDQQTSTADFMQQLWDTTTQTAISTVPMALLGVHGIKASNFSKNTLTEIAQLPEKYHGVVDQLQAEGKLNQDQVNDRKKMINTLAEIHSNLPALNLKGESISEEHATDLVAAIYQQRYYQGLKENSDVSLHPIYDAVINHAQSVINLIMQGKKVEPVLTTEQVSQKQKEAYRSDKGIDEDMRHLEDLVSIPGLKEQDPDAHAYYSENLDNPRAFYEMRLENTREVLAQVEKDGNEEEAKYYQKQVNENQRKLDHINKVDELYNKIKLNNEKQTSQKTGDQTQKTSEADQVLREAQQLFGNFDQSKDQPNAATKTEGAPPFQTENPGSREGQHPDVIDQQPKAPAGAAEVTRPDRGDGLQRSGEAPTQGGVNENQTQNEGPLPGAQDANPASHQTAAGEGAQQSGAEGAEVSPLQKALAAARASQNRDLTMEERLALARKELSTPESKPKRAIDRKAERVKKHLGLESKLPKGWDGTTEAAQQIREHVSGEVRSVFEQWRQGKGELSRDQFVFALRSGWVNMGDYVQFALSNQVQLSTEQRDLLRAVMQNPNARALMSFSLEFNKYLPHETAGMIFTEHLPFASYKGQQIYFISDLMLNPSLLMASDKTLFDVVMHEYAHRLTIRALTENQAFSTRVETLLQKARAQFESVEGNKERLPHVAYGLQNKYEFVAQLYNSPSFREFLKTVRAERKSTSLFNRIIDFVVQKIFGHNLSTAYDQLHRIVTNYAATREVGARTLKTDSGVELSDRSVDSIVTSEKGLNDMQAPGDAQRAALSRYHDVYQIARQFEGQPVEDFLKDPDLLSMFNAERPEDLSTQQRKLLYDIFYASPQKKDRYISAIRSAMKGNGNLKEALDQEFIKPPAPVRSLPAYRLAYDEQKGEWLRKDGKSAQQATAEEAFLDQLQHWTPSAEGESHRDAQNRDIKLGILLPDTVYTKDTVRLGASAARMQALVLDGFSRLGSDGLLSVVKQLDYLKDRFNQVSLNSFLTQLFQLHLYDKNIEDAIAATLDKSVASNTSAALNMRRLVGDPFGMDHIQHSVFYESFGDQGKQSGEALSTLHEVSEQSASGDFSEQEQARHEQGISEAQAQKQINEIGAEKSEQTKKDTTSKDYLKTAKAKANMVLNQLKNTYGVNEEKADAARKGVADGLIKKIKKIKC